MIEDKPDTLLTVVSLFIDFLNANVYKRKNFIGLGEVMDRQDKMIIALGIVILVIASIGIIYHEQTYVEKESANKISYKVIWKEFSDEITDGGMVSKNEMWENVYDILLNNDNACIYKVDLKINWVDDRNLQGILLGWNWTDEITADVNIPEMSFSQSQSGYSTISMDVLMDRPKDFTLETKNETQVKQTIKDRGYDNNEITCSLSLSISTKPIIIDSGNDFTVDILYHYCVPEIVEIT